ncbi:MAG: hypothetical protein MI725_02085, partial [Pirellulales bacterium]|nr:hypothetical protein [Pirellulales bacterium]
MAIIAKGYTKTAADFLVANRCAGRYVLSISDGLAALGAISIMAVWETHYEAGMTPIWWGMILLPVQLGIAATGFVIYRFRQTRALTLAQFLEMRYSRRLRIFVGLLAFTSGVFVFGIYPGFGARFFIHYCDLPDTLPAIMGIELSTYPVLMTILLGIALAFTLLGGQIAVVLTDFVQGMFCNIVFFIVLVLLVFSLDWQQVLEIAHAGPPDQSP